MNKTKKELKSIAKDRLHYFTGISVGVKQITLLEADGDGSYILFQVGKLFYSYNSRCVGESLAIYPDDTLTNGMVIRI